MSVNLVSGYEDVASRYNLATNGNFAVNQRGLFLSLADCKVGDFVADAWYIYSMSVDYCQAMQSPSGYLRFKGRGKRGQTIYLYSKDLAPLAYGDGALFDATGNTKSAITAAISSSIAGGVPFQVVPAPRLDTAAYAFLQASQPVHAVGRGQGYLSAWFQSTGAYTTRLYNANQPAYISIQLLADGEFDLYLTNFRELLGAYRNPPSAVVHPAEDLQRCQRYFASGSYAGMLPIYRTSSLNNAIVRVPFETRMAGTPTVAGTISSQTLYHLPTSGNGSSVDSGWTVLAAGGTVDAASLTLQRSVDQVTYPLLYVEGGWTATV